MLIGLLVAVMAIIMFIAIAPAIEGISRDLEGCSYFNCEDYVEATTTGATCTSTNQSYVTATDTNDFGCTIRPLITPFLILGVLISVITAIMYGRREEQPAPMYGGGYGGY